MTEREKLHTFVVYVENRPGVLNRIASLFRRRGYNIESLTVGHTERPGISRMTIVSAISAGAAHRVEANIYKLVNVLSVVDVTSASTVSRSLALIKVEARDESRRRLMEIVRVFRARVVDLAPRSLIIEITGAEEKIRALVEVLRPFGIVEMVRTGQVVMTRGLDQQIPEAVSQAPANEAAIPPAQNTPASTDHPDVLARVEETSHSV
jgi:acetolactate synthase I/III small subunit